MSQSRRMTAPRSTPSTRPRYQRADATTAPRASARAIIPTTTARSCWIPTATISRRCATRRADPVPLPHRAERRHIRAVIAAGTGLDEGRVVMPIEPPEIPPATPGHPPVPPPEPPPGNPRPEAPPPVREPGQPPQPNELPGEMPDEVPGPGPNGPTPPNPPNPPTDIAV